MLNQFHDISGGECGGSGGGGGGVCGDGCDGNCGCRICVGFDCICGGGLVDVVVALAEGTHAVGSASSKVARPREGIYSGL